LEGNRKCTKLPRGDGEFWIADCRFKISDFSLLKSPIRKNAQYGEAVLLAGVSGLAGGVFLQLEGLRKGLIGIWGRPDKDGAHCGVADQGKKIEVQSPIGDSHQERQVVRVVFPRGREEIQLLDDSDPSMRTSKTKLLLAFQVDSANFRGRRGASFYGH
jgi:hypothetical protein